jgi:tetratricopeptide (TPR) repeat protein
MTRVFWAGFFLAILTLVLHLVPFLDSRASFGTDALIYFPPYASLIIFCIALILIFPPTGQAVFTRLSSSKRSLPAIPAWVYALAAILLFWLARAATPLLGDGLDRIEALPAGLYAAIRGQPAPLDISLHWHLYKVLRPLFHARLEPASLAYAILSCAGGGIYVGTSVLLARKIFPDSPSRLMFLGGTIFPGGILLFAGYPENYSLLAALIPLWILSLFRIREQGFNAHWLIVLLILLTGLHFFAFLLVPPTLYYLYQSGRWRPQRMEAAFALIICLAFLGVMVYILRGHYRGVAAIFVLPQDWGSMSHLIDFIQSQLLASPAILVMIGLVPLLRGPTMEPAEKILFASSIIFVSFWFLLRPVIGAAFDWDLFSIPVFIYTPFLLIRLSKRYAGTPAFFYLTGVIITVSLFHTLPWLLLNASKEKSISRFKDRLAFETEKNQWAAGWGYYKLGKYLRQEGQVDDAFWAYDRAISANPGYSVLHEKIGLEMLGMGRIDLALAQLEEAHRINPTNPRIRDELVTVKLVYAKMLERGGQFREAEDQLKSILELDPEDKTALKALIDLYRDKLKMPQKARDLEQRLEQLREDE